MARKHRHSGLEGRSARLKLAVRKRPHNGPSLARGVLLLYRRNKGNGAWILKASNGHSKYWTRRIAEADDFDTSDGEKILTFYQAQDRAKSLARGAGEAADATAPLTVDGALVAYKADLIARGARSYNADHPRRHLTALLLAKPVQLLTSRELKAWRDGLLDTLAPATVNRVCNSLCAALELAAQHDPRVKNRDAWEVGCAGLPDAQRARNVVLSDAKVHAFIAAAYRHDPALGLFVDVLATTGARPGQASRLRVEDLHASAQPKLMLPKSGKGGGRNRISRKAERYSVPIGVGLSKRLKAAAAGRAPDAPLLVRANGSSWGNDPSLNYRRDVREVVAAIGEDPDVVTLYSLRHSNITRMLLKNLPIRLIASLHNTSVGQIERNYSANISETAIDDISRAGLLSEPAPADDNVVPLRR
jgi:integrase